MGDKGANEKKAQETLLTSLGLLVSFFSFPFFLFSFHFHFTNNFLGTNLNYKGQGHNDERGRTREE
jgi:hypothetical protein